MNDIRERFRKTDEEDLWRAQKFALFEESQFRRREAITGFRFRLAELSILAATATAALVAIRWGETGVGRFLSITGAVAFLVVCLAETVLVWRAAAGNEKLQVWCSWDTIGPLAFVVGLALGILGIVFLV